MQRTLVIGGAGFVGSHVCEALLAAGNDVIVLDNLSRGHRDYVPHGAEFIWGDIREPSWQQVLRPPDAIVHLAAIHHIPTCDLDPAHAYDVNVLGFQRVLDAARTWNVKRVVAASSGAVYAPTLSGALHEDLPTAPQNPYGISKLANEMMLRHATQTWLREGVCVRLFNVVGPRETNEHLIPDILRQLSSDVIVLGNLAPRRDFIHVHDAARAFAILANTTLPESYNVFNVGTGCEHSVADVARLALEAAGKTGEVRSRETLQRSIDRPSQRADFARLSALTGWRPTKNLPDALRDALAHHTPAKSA